MSNNEEKNRDAELQAYKSLKKKLIKASKEYYENSNSIMTDFEFDMKLKELEEMEKSMGYADPDSPTQKPGSDLSDTKSENRHKRPMLSLENTYTLDEVEKWYSDMVKASGDKNLEVVVNPKWDGSSGALRYSNGKIEKALTRGNGEVGEDISTNVKYLNDNVWSTKGSYGVPFSGEARGELIMTTEGFEKLNVNNEFQNARNLVSGTLKLLNIYSFISRADSIKFYAYWLEDSDSELYSQDLLLLKMNGFDVGDFYICHNISEIREAIATIEIKSYDVAIDGAVMKVNKKALWDKIGSTAKAPKWAKAFKYKQETVSTKVKSIDFQVARTGKVTPVVYFEPKFIDGSEIQKATLNNKDFYENMDIAVGDEISVQKAAAIIPQVVEITKRPKDRKVINFPDVCPICGTTLVKYNDEHNDVYCPNKSCKARIIDAISNYTHMLEIDGFADIIIERLYDAGLLTSIEDLYTLKYNKEEISQLDRLSMKIAEKLCANIETSKLAEFWKILSALGIPNVGKKTAKILTARYNSMEELQKATAVDLAGLNDIAEITASGIVKYLAENKSLISKLTEFGVNMKNSEQKTISSELNGKSFCITGALSQPRKTYEELIEKAGGKNVSGVTSKTDYLVTNDTTSGSTKNRKAVELNIPIINEEELKKMLGI